jgi:ribosomal protein S18 acetylase RimI-like enzyme
MPNIVFVPATVADIPLLRQLADAIWHAHYPAVISVAQINYMLARMYAVEVIENEMQAGTCWELIRLDDETVGFLSYSGSPGATQLKLHKLYLRVDRHGQGLGQASLRHLMDVAEGLGAKEISLYVNKNNSKAVRAYARFGYTIAESVVNEFGGGFVMNDYRMTIICK